MKHPGDHLATNLQNIREDRNLSLDKLAELTGVSKSMLRQIEIGQSNPTIATIWKIANGLRLPFSTLLREQSQKISIRAFTGEPSLHTDLDGYHLHPLIRFDPERPFETYYLEIKPGVGLDAEPHQGNVEEYVFVLKGELTIRVEDTDYAVQEKEFIHFAANCEHGYKNPGEKQASVMMVLSYLP